MANTRKEYLDTQNLVEKRKDGWIQEDIRSGKNEEPGHSCLTRVLAYAEVVIQHHCLFYDEIAFSYETP